MKRIILATIGGVIIIGGGATAIVLSSQPATDKHEDTQTRQHASELKDLGKAPDFELTTHEGETVTLADSESKIKVINSWATWCPFCKDELPDFARLQAQYPEHIAVIAINRGESREKSAGYVSSLPEKSQKITYALDPQDSFYQRIGGFTMPETLFVDEENVIRIHKRGPMEFEEMKEKTEKLLNRL